MSGDVSFEAVIYIIYSYFGISIYILKAQI